MGTTAFTDDEDFNLEQLTDEEICSLFTKAMRSVKHLATERFSER